MSDPPTPLPPPNIPDPHHLPLIHGRHTTAGSTSANREYRKGNWTVEETMILITAKRLDDERRLKSTSNPNDPSKPPPASCRTSGELRWKWVENYCWSHGCMRSQNQCNDKWDNLLRDYKKVRDYESKSQSQSQSQSQASSSNNVEESFPSYWTMDKHQRKQRNLPSNILFEVYQAITEILHRKHAQNTTQLASPVLPISQLTFQQRPPSLLPPPPPPPPPPTQPPPPPPSTSPPLVSGAGSDSEASGSESSETKRRKVGSIGSSVLQSAEVLARALRSSDERKEKRHRELMELEERRLLIEEKRNEDNRQGIASLVTAVTNLSGAIQSLISDNHHRRRS